MSFPDHKPVMRTQELQKHSTLYLGSNVPEQTELTQDHKNKVRRGGRNIFKPRLCLRWRQTLVKAFYNEEEIDEHLTERLEFIEHMNTINVMLRRKPINVVYNKLENDFSVVSNFTQTIYYSQFDSIEDMVKAVKNLLKQINKAA